MPEIIEIKKVSKTYKNYNEQPNSLSSIFAHPFRKIEKKRFEVLKDISFSIKQGEFVGIIGRNGSGKSTLLKLLAGIYEPDSGSININGSLVPFLELGVGFSYDLTARENIFLNGIILGLTLNRITSHFKKIVDFAQISEFLNMPLKNYSSGMTVRLAFSIAISIPADIYLMDEVLAVGDEQFQDKCYRVFDDMKRNKKTIVFVSHDMSAVKRYCDRVIVIDDHKVMFDGDPEKAINIYHELNNQK